MPRAPRPLADGLLYHAINRGNNRAAVFFATEDYLTFLKAVGQTQRRYPFRLFGYWLSLVELSCARHGANRSFADALAGLGNAGQG